MLKGRSKGTPCEKNPILGASDQAISTAFTFVKVQLLKSSQINKVY